jgi:hypothetical protein
LDDSYKVGQDISILTSPNTAAYVTILLYLVIVQTLVMFEMQLQGTGAGVGVGQEWEQEWGQERVGAVVMFEIQLQGKGTDGNRDQDQEAVLILGLERTNLGVQVDMYQEHSTDISNV